mmetsp:Transcript_12214/g.18426  ORF Transcript_12214/g.18426 Transcript_12214/m.18426 type:complete len:239 (-) Transcript_12214:94-810(-)
MRGCRTGCARRWPRPVRRGPSAGAPPSRPWSLAPAARTAVTQKSPSCAPQGTYPLSWSRAGRGFGSPRPTRASPLGTWWRWLPSQRRAAASFRAWPAPRSSGPKAVRRGGSSNFASSSQARLQTRAPARRGRCARKPWAWRSGWPATRPWPRGRAWSSAGSPPRPPPTRPLQSRPGTPPTTGSPRSPHGPRPPLAPPRPPSRRPRSSRPGTKSAQWTGSVPAALRSLKPRRKCTPTPA